LLEAVDANGGNSDTLRSAADELDMVSGSCAYSSAAASYAALADLLRGVALLVEWRAGVLDGARDADRFLRGAKERYKLWVKEYQSSQIPSALLTNSASIVDVNDIAAVGAICSAIAATPLPVPFFAAAMPPFRQREKGQQDPKEAPIELAVAFVRFVINGVPANETHFLKPREAHDLEIEVRVSRWPDAASTLQLSPVSIESPETYDFPKFQFQRPAGQSPFLLKQRGRALLKAPQSLHARPFEFKYAAEFAPRTSEQPIAVVGQRTLRIESVDIQSTPLTGYPDMDRKLLAVRDQLRTQRWISESDLQASLVLLTALCGLACRALHDGLYPGVRSEADFQPDVRSELRRTPEIASQLEEHARAAGGITDLSFRGIRIELKVEPHRRLTLADCERYVEQTASYVVATGKRVGILCVLDCSPKDAAPAPAEEGFGILLRSTREGDICIVTLIVQGNLRTPSHLSR